MFKGLIKLKKILNKKIRIRVSCLTTERAAYYAATSKEIDKTKNCIGPIFPDSSLSELIIGGGEDMKKDGFKIASAELGNV